MQFLQADHTTQVRLLEGQDSCLRPRDGCRVTHLVLQGGAADFRWIGNGLRALRGVDNKADFIVFVYRHKVHDEKAPDIAELILGKARHAEQNAKCYMRFDNGNLMDTNQAAAFNQIDAYNSLNQKRNSSTYNS